MLTDQSFILTSQDGLLKTICDTLEQLLTATSIQPLQTSSLAVVEGEKSKDAAATAAEKPSSSSVPPPRVIIEEEADDEEYEDIEPHG